MFKTDIQTVIAELTKRKYFLAEFKSYKQIDECYKRKFNFAINLVQRGN